jgi:lipid A 3-O-deacylase
MERNGATRKVKESCPEGNSKFYLEDFGFRFNFINLYSVNSSHEPSPLNDLTEFVLKFLKFHKPVTKHLSEPCKFSVQITMSEKKNKGMDKILLLSGLLLTLFFSCSHASCRENNINPVGSEVAGKWIIAEENDVLAAKNPDDRAYTQGLRVSYQYFPGCEPDRLKKWGYAIADSKLGNWLGISTQADVGVMATTAGIGQHMFTPNDISISELIADDRPYTGWLYGTLRYEFVDVTNSSVMGAYNKSYFDGLVKGQRYHSFELQLGALGDASFADRTQIWFHKQIDAQKPMGWENQLDSEPGVFAEYKYGYRYFIEDDDGKVKFDIIPSAGLAVGNVQTYASAGFMVRYGRNIRGFPSSSLTPVVSIKEKIDKICGLKIFEECYAFVGAQARYVVHNFFLEGSIFNDEGHSVDAENFVYDYLAGFRFAFPWQGLTIDYTYIRRSNEFSPMPANSPLENGEHDYGSLIISFNREF